MDFLDPNKKRAHIRRIYIGYILIGIGILLSTFILVYISYGYKLDRQTGNIVKNGLIFLNAAPESASIFLNGKANGSTEKRLTVPEGEYNIELRRSGYTTWKKNVQLTGSSIERLVYPKLFPEKLEPANIKNYDNNPSFSTQSLDRKWVITSAPGSITNFDVFNTAEPTDPTTSIKLPASIYTGAKKASTNKLELIEWSSDNKHFLVKHHYDGKYEFVLISRDQPETSRNLNTFFNLAPKEIVLRDKDPEQFYIWQSDLTLSTANLESAKLTPVIKQVNSFMPHQEKLIIYSINDPTKPGQTTLKIRDDKKDYVIADFSKSDLLLDLVKFDDHWYAVATSKVEDKMYIYKDPIQKINRKVTNATAPYAILKITDPLKLSFSANTRFVMAQSSKSAAIYDFEEDERHSFDFKSKLPEGQIATWMDGHRIITTSEGKVEVFEFDNQNHTTLVPITSNSLPFFDRSYERLFTLAKTNSEDSKSKQISLTKTFLKLNLKD